MNLKCMIVEDEPVARKILEEYIADVDFLELDCWAEDPLRAMSMLEERKVDIIFLDINMPKITGINFLKNIKTSVHIIMTTAFPNHAVEAFELDVVDYLVKPISFERFLKACTKVKSLEKNKYPVAEQQKPDHFYVKCDGQIRKVSYDQLLYAEAMMNYVMLYTTKEKLMVYLTIKGLEEQLPADLFLKVHKSFIVNRNKVNMIEGNLLDLAGAKVPIGQNFKEAVVADLLKDRLIKR